MTSSHFHFVSTELSQRKTTTQIYFFVLIFVSVSRENCSNRQRVEDAEKEGQRGRETDRERGGGGWKEEKKRKTEKKDQKRRKTVTAAVITIKPRIVRICDNSFYRCSHSNIVSTLYEYS